jgi:hypothetical protein
VSRRARRLVVIAVVALVALAGGGLAALPQIVRWLVVRQLGATTHRTVTLDAVELDLFKGHFALRGLRVTDRDRSPLATMERLEIRFSPRDLLRGHLHVTDAVLQTMTVRIVRTGPSDFNISDLLARKSAGGTTPAITFDRFQLLGGAVVIEDRMLSPPRTWRAQIGLDARDASTVAGRPPGAATLSVVVANASVSLSMTDLHLSPLQFRAKLTARDVDASLAALYLPAASPLSPARGTVSASATIDQDPVVGTRVALDAGFSGIELRQPGQDSAFLSAPAVRVTVEDLRVRSGLIKLGRVAVDAGSVVLEDARPGHLRRRWQVDGVLFEARNLSSARDASPGVAQAGAVMAGARVSVWVANVRLAPLELHATTIVRDVDLALLRLYLPPDVPVQPERGVVNATLQVDHDASRGTRLALDVRLAGIELHHPRHVVTAPSFRIAAEDIAFNQGAVTVGHVAVESDRLTLEERTATPVRTWVVQNLAAEAKGLSSRREALQGIATVRATVAGGTVSAWITHVRLDPLELHVTTILRNFDVAVLRLYLPWEAAVQPDRGVVDASFNLDQTVANGTRVAGDVTLTGVEARGRGTIGTLAIKASSLRATLTDARRQGTALRVGRIELTGSGSVTDTRAAAARVDIAQLRIASEGLTWPVRGPARVELSARFGDRGELDGNGTARLTAPLPAIAWAADVSLRFKAVDLTPLGTYVPAANGFGGRVRATLTANVAYASALTARVRGDVGGGRFALADGDRTLLSIRRIDATGLDVQWPERVAIEQLRLVQPYALVERDREGRFTLAARFASSPRSAVTSGAATGAERPAVPSIAVGQVIVEAGRATLVDGSGAVPARIELPRVALTVRDMTWPASKPAGIRLDVGLPQGGTMKAEGTVSAAPVSVDVTLTVKDADLSPLQPYLGVRASVGARLDANLTVAGPVSPAPRLSVRGNVGLRNFVIGDGQEPVITVEQIAATGIDATWPEQVTVDRVRIRRSWARIERDRQGVFLLRALLERSRATAPPRETAPAPPAATGATIFRVREAILEQQAATIIDGITTPAARFDIAGARLAVQDFTWPSRGPLTLELIAPAPGGGRLNVSGTLDLEPVRLDARAVLDGVSLEPAQPYLPIEGRVTGKVTGELAVKIGLEPLSVKITGQTRLQGFRLSDGDRPVVTVGRVETAGIDIDWPRRIALQSVLLRRPRLLIERDAQGGIPLSRLITPHWAATAPAASARGGSPPARSTPAPAQPPTIEIATFTLERASARFVDQTTTPPYAEELSDVNVAFTGVTTVPDRRMRFTANGAVGGGSFKLVGEAASGKRPLLDLKVDLRDFVVPRANPYLNRFTAWTATRGSFSASAGYTLNGTQLDTRHDLVVRDLEVTRSGERDEVQRRLGLPFGFLVALLKDARGEIHLSVPVAGDVSKQEFDFEDTVWSAVRALALRLVAMPFSRVGSLFVSHDSKIEAVAITPVVFEAGTTELAPPMEAHLVEVAKFLRGSPELKLALEPILTQADVDALKKDRAQTPLPDAMRQLAAERLDVVRQALAAAGGVDAARLSGVAPRTPLVEAAGAARVELNLRQ